MYIPQVHVINISAYGSNNTCIPVHIDTCTASHDTCTASHDTEDPIALPLQTSGHMGTH